MAIWKAMSHFKPTHLCWQTGNQDPKAEAWRKTKRTTEEKLVTWREPLGRLQRPGQTLESSGKKDVIVMPQTMQVPLPTLWPSAYLSPQPLRQVSWTQMPYAPGWRILQTQQIRWWHSWSHKLEWHLSSSCCGTCCMKTKQQAHPMPRTGSKISEWLHLSKPTKKNNMRITYHKHFKSIEAQGYFFFIQSVCLILFHVNFR